MVDVAQTADGDLDLMTEDADIRYVESTEQHERDLLLLGKGELKGAPEWGVGIVGFVGESDPELLLRTVRKELGRDGMRVRSVGMVNGYLTIEAEYDNGGNGG